MKCPNCRCEIGNLTTCPYCGVTLYRRPQTAATDPVRVPPTRQVPPPRAAQAPYSRPVQNASRKNAETSGLELYALVGVVLLCGIFILEALQLAAILL